MLGIFNGMKLTINVMPPCCIDTTAGSQWILLRTLLGPHYPTFQKRKLRFKVVIQLVQSHTSSTWHSLQQFALWAGLSPGPEAEVWSPWSRLFYLLTLIPIRVWQQVSLGLSWLKPGYWCCKPLEGGSHIWDTAVWDTAVWEFLQLAWSWEIAWGVCSKKRFFGISVGVRFRNDWVGALE